MGYVPLEQASRLRGCLCLSLFVCLSVVCIGRSFWGFLGRETWVSHCRLSAWLRGRFAAAVIGWVASLAIRTICIVLIALLPHQLACAGCMALSALHAPRFVVAVSLSVSVPLALVTLGGSSVPDLGLDFDVRTPNLTDIVDTGIFRLDEEQIQASFGHSTCHLVYEEEVLRDPLVNKI